MQANPALYQRSWLPLLAFAGSIFGLVLIGIATYHSQLDQHRAEVAAQLRAISELRVGQLSRWHAATRTSSEFLAQGGQIADHFAAWAEGGYQDKTRVERIQARIAGFKTVFGYHSVSLFDRSGVYRLSDHRDPVMLEHQQEALQAMQERAAVFVDFHRHGANLPEPMLGMMVPLLKGHGEAAQIVGAVLISIAPQESLFPRISQWPTHSPSGETVLVRTQGREMQMIYASRSQASTGTVSLRPHPPIAATQFLRGASSPLLSTIDYRHVPVLAYGTRVPGTPWLVIVKQDQAEIDAPVLRLAWYSALGTGLLLLLSSWYFWRWWQRQRHEQQTVLSNKDAERRVLQRRYDFLSRYAGDVILLADAEARILEINEQVLYLHGYPIEEVKGQPVTLFWPPDAVAETTRRLEAAMKTGAQTYETEHRRKDGSRIPVEVSTHVIDAQGVTYFHVLVRDITERKQADEQLRMQALVLDQIQDHVTITDLKGVITYVNDAECRNSGRPRAALVGQHIEVYGSDPEAEANQAEIGRITLEAGAWRGKVRTIQPDGSMNFSELRTALVRDSAGQPRYMVGIGTNISERIAAEQALQEREARYRGVIETSADGFWMTDLEGRLLEVNEAYCRRSGYSREELLAMCITDLEAQEKPEDTARHMTELIRNGSSLFESVHRAKDGTPWQVEVNTSYSPLQGGCCFVFLRDVHQRNRSEALLRTRLRLSDIALKGSLDELMKASLDAAELYTGSHIGFFHFFDPDQDSLTLQAWSSNTVDRMCTIEAQQQAKGQHYAVKLAGVWADAIRQRQPLIHNDYASLPDKKGMPPGHATLLRELVVPVLRDNKVTAVLGVGNKASNYVDEDIEVVEQIASMVMDVVARKHAEAQLKQSNARLLEAQRIARVGHWIYEVGVDQMFVSEQLNVIAGLDPGLAEMTLAESALQIHPDDRAIYQRDMDGAIGQGTPFQHEVRLVRPDGTIRSLWTTGAATRDAEGKVVRVSGTRQDITERVEAEARVRQAATVFDNTAEGITITDPTGAILAVNRAFTEITGYSEAEALGRNPSLLKSGRHDAEYYQSLWAALKAHGAWSGEIWNRRKSGEIYPEWLAINAVRDSEGRTVNYIGVFTDLSSRMAMQAKLDYQSRHHALTGLLNSAGLLEQLRLACDTAATGEQLALLVLNIDRFAQLNETLGRDRGDAVLIALARRWEALIADAGSLCHMSADQFGLLLRDFEDNDSVLEIGARLLDSMRQPIQLDGIERPIALTLSIGVAFYPGDAPEASALLHGAEEAMRQAKADKGNQMRFFDHAQAQRVREWFEIESALRGVLDRDELFLDYQPQVDTATGRIVAAEALLRWRQGNAVIPPGRFIHVVEGTDLAEPVSRWVLDSACRQARQWLDRQRPLRVAVNIFSEHVTSGHLVDDIAAVLARTGLPAQLLELEVVESSLLKNPEAAARTLRELKRMGVGLALDDFGTGYSSLGYLKHYPFDVLKIDQMFSRSITRDPEDAAIVRSTIALAHNLGMRVLAEGVETAPQLRFLARYGCDELQGYLLSRPVDPAAVELRVMERRDLRPAELAGTASAPCLLLLEDEEVQAAIVTELLEDAGYRVRVAEDRDSALHQVDSHAIDLIVADHYLKGITGVELLVELRRLYPEIPAIMLSSADEQAVVIDAVNRAAIRGFLHKPVAGDELLRNIRDLLGAERRA